MNRLKASNYNKILSNKLKKVIYPKKGNSSKVPTYKTRDEYNKSLKNIKKFGKKIKPKRKRSIDAIIFNKKNGDGITSALIVVEYLRKKLSDFNEYNIKLIPVGPASGSFNRDRELTQKINLYKDKNIIVLDLQYDKERLNFLKKNSKSILLIDDHPLTKNIIKKTNLKEDEYFIGDDKHGTCTYTHKFFYPKKKVPDIIQIFDMADRPIYLPYLPNYQQFKTFIEMRYIHNARIQWSNYNSFNNLAKCFNNINLNFASWIGHYFFELKNNIKEQVAKNAVEGYFEGHPVYILNYSDPVLTKMVARQMVSNAEMMGHNIHFAVIWGFEHRNGVYRIHLSEKHDYGQAKYNLPDIAKKLGNIGKTGKGGGGSKFIGNFYWPRNKTKDIWDLFTKKSKYL